MYFTNITGGEPFIRTDLKDIVRELYKKSDRIVISTNGVIPEIKATFFISFIVNGLMQALLVISYHIAIYCYLPFGMAKGGMTKQNGR